MVARWTHTPRCHEAGVLCIGRVHPGGARFVPEFTLDLWHPSFCLESDFSVCVLSFGGDGNRMAPVSSSHA